MVYSNFKRILLILLCIFVVIFPFWCVAGLCSENEDVELSIVPNLRSSNSSNFFTYNTEVNQYYCELDEGYIYTIHNDSNEYVGFCFCNSVPAQNVPYYDYTLLAGGRIYSFIVDSSFDYVVFSANNFSDINKYLTRTRVDSMTSSVDDLVDNVGPSAIWNIFDTGINYIYVVVIAAFGIFIVALVIRKITKGKEGF